MCSSKDIRQQFIDFFKEKQHEIVSSAGLIPQNDPTLLFINAGMNQFKNIFLGLEDKKFDRIANSQKCIRAGGKHNDLEEVGTDGYHHTFFEMLGNWSFGDYYKKEAIEWAWELITEVWKLPKEKLFATVHDSDNEAAELWKSQTDIDPAHVEFHGDKDNFWEMADVGPCGPCSEIHIDRGIEHCNLQDDPNHVCKVNGDCHRYIELWNLVFIQYNRDKGGTLNPLKSKYVDTGAGFERICQVLQDKSSNYETDLFIPLLIAIEEISGTKYNPDASGTSHRVIADHIRALSFAIADGGMPSNEGRGYVLRRILRRAARHGRLLNIHKPFLYKLVDVLIDVMGHHFSELAERKEHVVLTIKAEEERFNATLDKGLDQIEEIFKANEQDKVISGKDAFTLYDTYGFPVDLTTVIAEEKGYTVDLDGFNKAMEEQRERARKSQKFVMDIEQTEWIEFTDNMQETEFVGYDSNCTDTKIVKFSFVKDDIAKIVLTKTPFYAEQGGQVADKGDLSNDDTMIKVFDVKKENNEVVHYGKILNGKISDGEFQAVINTDRRKEIARNHTATHLLHKALQTVLGDHVHQKGSLVNPDNLRFDFTHYEGVKQEDLEKIERIVNNEIMENHKLVTDVMNYDEAKESGATALFGEKYGDSVRVVSAGDFSKELCGGTHVGYTGEIGSFKIMSESSSSAGVRRIFAITGSYVLDYNKKQEEKLQKVCELLNVPEKNMLNKIEKLLEENKELSREIEKLQAAQKGDILTELLKKADEIDGVKVVAARIDVNDNKEFRATGDQLRDKIGSGIGVLIADIGGKVSIITIVTKDLIKKYQAGKIVGKVAEIVGGKGGGRPDMAMAGGKDASKIDEAVTAVPEIIKNI